MQTAAKVSKKETPKKSASPKSALRGGAVAVRMYRGLLGDFFLVSHTTGKAKFRILIDCGVLQLIGSSEKKPSTASGKERIKAGVANLMEETGGFIDLVVATHEHYDHLSGFILANDAFESLKIGELWLAWTEDQSDRIANRYRDTKRKALHALKALADNTSLSASPEMESVHNLLQFYGAIDPLGDDALTVARASESRLPGNVSCETVISWLKRRAGTGNVRYLKPGEAVRWGVGGVFRAYVLGPPRNDEELMRKLDPSKRGESEVYLTRSEDVETMIGLAALHSGDRSQATLRDQPFAPLHRRNSKIGSARELPIAALYENESESWRRIDTEWLGSAEDLALKIDGDVNNTSLVLALELPARDVLLFAADAQVGNWLSWSAQTYPGGEGRSGGDLTVENILERTILYKVGHHASHNATLRERGLELMTDERLCALIPVVAKTAKEQSNVNTPGGWKMPYLDLYNRLEELTAGRILRGDGDLIKETKAFRSSAFTLQYGPSFKKKDPLWVELSVAV